MRIAVAVTQNANAIWIDTTTPLARSRSQRRLGVSGRSLRMCSRRETLFCENQPIEVLPALVRVDDVLHQAMANDVAALQLHDSDPLDPPELRQRIDQAAALFLGQVYLGDVAGDDHLALVAEPGQKHQHL